MSRRSAHIASKAQEAKWTARRAATNPWMILLARCGYAAKGIVYLIIGGLAIQLALGKGGSATDQRGALRVLSEQSFGKYLLLIVAIGLAAYAVWSFIQAIFDTEGKGHKAKGIIGRLGYVAVGITYALLAWGAFQLYSGSGNGGKSSTGAAQDWTATLLKEPFGVALVVIVGLIALVVAGTLFVKAYQAKFRYRLNLTSLRPAGQKLVTNLGRLGYAAQAVVFEVIGIFFIIAATQNNASKAKGLDGALQELIRQPFGPIILGVVAFGFIAYGVYSLVEARYRRLGGRG